MYNNTLILDLEPYTVGSKIYHIIAKNAKVKKMKVYNGD